MGLTLYAVSSNPRKMHEMVVRAYIKEGSFEKGKTCEFKGDVETLEGNG
jgi:hypothetical protein